MSAKTPAQRVRETEARKRAAGLKQIRIWVPDDPDSIAAVRAAARALCGKERRQPYKRSRPRADRKSDQIWQALADAGTVGLTTAELEHITGAAISTCRHHLRRWTIEGLVQMEGGTAGAPATWIRTSTIGPLAPLCHGPLCSGRGYTDPNRGT